MAGATSEIAFGSSASLHPTVRLAGTDFVYSIVVIEAAEESSDESLAASSVVIPPAPSLTEGTLASAEPPSLTTPSGPLSEDGSVDSGLSLIDVPSSPEMSDDEFYEDSRAQQPAPRAQQGDEFVVVYDTSVSGDD